MPAQLNQIVNTKMGNTKSTNQSLGPQEKPTQKRDSKFTSYIQAGDNSDNRNVPREDLEVTRIKKNIKNNPEVFILNNLMMCVDFFKNYDEEISELRETLVSPQEMALNKHLLPQKRVLLPDVLQERIANNVTFISRRETIDPTVEPLQPVRMFVVYENIEVSDQHDSSQYSTMNDTITYNMRIKPSKHKGYVHLQRIGITPSKKNPPLEEDLSSIAENGDECFSDSESYHYNYSKSKATPCREGNLSTPNRVSSKLIRNKSAPNLLDDTSEFYERISDSGRNKLSGAFEGYKDDTDYGSMSDSRSVQNQGPASTREPENQRRGFSRHGQYPKLKNQFVNASPASSTSSGYKSGNYDSDSEYGLSSAKAFNKPKFLDPAEMPESCFSLMTTTPDDRIYDPTENKKKSIISSKERWVQVERNRHNYDVWYLNSAKFRRRFYIVFLESLATTLGLEQVVSFRRPHFFGPVIYCDKVEVSQTAKCNISESYEIVPCVWSHWPECANEWLHRSRHSWPDYEIIHHIRKSGCYIIPQEFRSKDDNLNYKTEWQLAFPAAERYLETCMSHAQMRVYIIVLMLHKTFIRAVESAPDRLNTHQIRNQLFWLMEQSLFEWTVNRTGDYLLKLLQCLCKCINQDEAFLKDYFLEGKNLFKNSEKGSLFFSLKQLKRILENPVMYVLHALENIRYKSQFFPKLDYEELLRILTTEELLLINPNLQKSSVSSSMQNFMEDETYSVRRGFWDDAKKNKEQFSNFRKPVTNKTLINPSRAHDSVVDIAIRCGELKGIRLSKLLNFFIEHLIKMGEKYHEYGALQQKTDYLQHAMSLCILLAEDEMFRDEARVHVQEIIALQKLVTRSRSQNEPPATPKRNPGPPSFPLSLNNSSPTRSSMPLLNDDATREPLEIKKTSDSSIFSQSLKDRYSFMSNRPSIPLPDTSASSSRSSSPPMKKKSDPPAYLRPLRDRFIVTPDVSTSLSVLEEKKENDVNGQSSVSVDQGGTSVLKGKKEPDINEQSNVSVDQERTSVLEEKENDAVDVSVDQGGTSVLKGKKEPDTNEQSNVSVDQERTSVLEEKGNDAVDVSVNQKKATALQDGKEKDSISKSSVSVDERHDSVLEEQKDRRVSVQRKISVLEKKKENDVTSQSRLSVNSGRLSVKDRIKMLVEKKEDSSKTKDTEEEKKRSQKYEETPLTNDADDNNESSHNTYI